MPRIAGQWLRGSNLDLVLAQDLSLVAQWLGSISAHEDKIKKYIPEMFFFFFFLKFEIWIFFFFFLGVNASFFFFFFPFFFFFFFFNIFCFNIFFLKKKRKKKKEKHFWDIFFDFIFMSRDWAKPLSHRTEIPSQDHFKIWATKSWSEPLSHDPSKPSFKSSSQNPNLQASKLRFEPSSHAELSRVLSFILLPNSRFH